jgi:hypothetical protein
MFPFHALPGLPALAVAALTAQAQAQPVARPDPLDPAAAVPAVVIVSAIPRDARTPADKPVSWREANDTVARIGGWRVYARESRPAEAAPAAPSHPHTGHRSP